MFVSPYRIVELVVEEEKLETVLERQQPGRPACAGAVTAGGFGDAIYNPSLELSLFCCLDYPAAVEPAVRPVSQVKSS